MKKSFLLIPAFLFCLFENSLAQDLHIYYDAETTLIKYIYDGEEIKSPKVKKDGNIFLHVENYNNYIYSLEVKANNQLLQIPPGSGLGSIIPLGGTGVNIPLMGDSGAGGGYINIPGGGGDEFGFVSEEEEDSDFEQFQLLYLEYEGILNNMVKKEAAFSKIYEEVGKIEIEREFRSIGLSEIHKIKWNPNLTPAQVKRMSYQFLNKILEIEDTSQITLDYLIQKGDDRPELSKSRSLLEKNSKDYDEDVADLTMFSEKIKNVNLSFDEFFFMQDNAIEIQKKALDVQQSIETQKALIDKLYKNTGTKELQKMTSIWYEYEALKANDFSYTYRTEATGDRTVLSIKFTAKDSLGNVLPINKKELAPIKVPVYGGMKINVSVGLSFGQYFDQPQSYYLQDTVILAENADAFLPIITSFFHFYPQRVGNLSIGGNFGIGIPISNSESGQSVSFFLGPSFIFGKSQRIVLSTGLMGGKVQQLSQGLKAGDKLPPFSAVPTRNSYQLGYFLGVSFNIAGG